MDEAWAPQKKDEEQQQIMWLNKLPPGVKIPLTAEQMVKVAKMDADGNSVRQKQYEETGRHSYVSTTISQNSSAAPVEKYRSRSSSSYEGLFKEIEDDDISDDNKKNHTQIKVVDKHETSRGQSQQHIRNIKEACRLQLNKEVYGNQTEKKEHTGSSRSSYGIPDKQNDTETHIQPGSAKIVKERKFAPANTNSNDSTANHIKEAYKDYPGTETSGNKITDHQETRGMGSNDEETSVSTGIKQKEACSSSQKHSTGESNSSSEEQTIKPKTKEEQQDDDLEINPDPPTKMEEEMDKMFNSDDYLAVDEIISAAIPKEGARFKTRDDVFYRYALYARKTRFAVKKFSSKRSGKNGEIYMQTFTCNKQGCTNKEAKTSSQRRINTLVKSDCQAHIIVREFEGFGYIKKVRL
ncbi:hypothetical protein ACQ4PT_026341 [Festuca glaucescens]